MFRLTPLPQKDTIGLEDEQSVTGKCIDGCSAILFPACLSPSLKTTFSIPR